MLYISLAIIQAILFEAHFLVYRTLIDIFSPGNASLSALKIIFAALSVSFILASILAHTFQNRFVRIVYSAAAIWFGFLVYLLLACALYWVVVLFGGKEVSTTETAFAGMVFFIGALALGVFGLLNADNIRIKKISISIPRLPEAWQGRKAVMVSDIHLGQIREGAFAKKIAELVRGLSPDIVFFVGDVFDGVKTDTDRCLRPLSLIGAPLGSFFVHGNHEEFKKDSADEYGAALRKAGIRVLENETTMVEGVEIIGITDSDTLNKEKYRTELEHILGAEKTGPRILLKHTPVWSDVAEAEGIDLELSGHTHGGQIFPINIITPLLFKDRNYGLSKSGDMVVYTSSGAGTSGPPMRIGTDPEIVLIDFQNRPS
jgi:predicted MPP superfamily phosphohydrolase